MKRYLIICVALTLLGCGPEQVSFDRDRPFVILDWESDSQTYALIEAPIPGLHDVEQLDGPAVHVLGGGDLVAATTEPRTEEDFRDALTVEGADAPDLQYSVEGDLVVAFDFDTLMMFTVFHHLDIAHAFFESLNVRDVGKIPVYYRPILESGFLAPIPLFTDNAAYAFTLDAFIIPPQLLLTGVPLAANRGVIVHEYSHAVFNRLVHQDRRAPRYLLEDWPNVAANELSALDEGVADIFGAYQTGDPNFIAPSISGSFAGDQDRDLSVVRTYDAGLAADTQFTDNAEYNPYALGSVVASIVWALRELTDDEAILRAVIAGLRAIEDPGPEFRITNFFEGLHGALPTDTQPAACALFEERLGSDLTCEGVQ